MPDVLFTLLLALVVLGPKKLPQIAARLENTWHSFSACGASCWIRLTGTSFRDARKCWSLSPLIRKSNEWGTLRAGHLPDC